VPHFDSNFIDRVRNASDVVEVIGTCVPLKRAGTNFVGLCPFHKEKSPSFNVNAQKQIFHCFGCQTGGDVFKFIQLYENITFPESVARLAERARIPMESDSSPGAQQARGLKDHLLKLHEAICQRWQHCLASEASGQVARDYLAKRGLPTEAIREFRLGAAPESWDDTVNWARSKGYEPGLVEQAGLIIARETGGHYDRFRGRLMFPICDEQGRVIAFSGRVLSGDEKIAKYVNSPETPIFTKGKVLFALDKAKRAILDAGHAVICEGQIDTIACHVAGVRNVVAPQGTALTADHARVLKRYVNEVVLCFDGDGAGTKAAVRSLDDLLASGLAIRVASIPPPDDPDSYLKTHGPEAFQAILKRADGYFDFLLRHLCQQNDLGTDRGRTTVVRAMAEAVHKTGSAVLVDTYAQKTSQRLGVAVDAVRMEFRKVKMAGTKRPEPEIEEDESDNQPPVRPPQAELWLLKLLLLTPELTDFAVNHLDPAWITDERVRRIAAVHLSQTPSVASLLNLFEGEAGLSHFISEAASEQRSIPEPEKQLIDVILKLRNASIDRQISELNSHLVDSGLTDDERMEALSMQQRLRTERRNPLIPLDGGNPPESEPL
jgi:DNA primase